MDNYGYGATTSQAASPMGMAKITLGNQLENALGRIHSASERARAIGDKLTGPRPEAVENNPTSPQPNAISYTVDQLHQSITRLDNFIARIENAI